MNDVLYNTLNMAVLLNEVHSMQASGHPYGVSCACMQNTQPGYLSSALRSHGLWQQVGWQAWLKDSMLVFETRSLTDLDLVMITLDRLASER